MYLSIYIYNNLFSVSMHDFVLASRQRPSPIDGYMFVNLICPTNISWLR